MTMTPGKAAHDTWCADDDWDELDSEARDFWEETARRHAALVSMRQQRESWVTGMDELIAFVTARLDEDEAAAQAAAEADGSAVWVTGGTEDDDKRSIRAPAPDDWYRVADRINTATAGHVARHDPARVLREVEAKRAIVELHDRVHDCPVAIPVSNPEAFAGSLGYVSTEHVDGEDPHVSPCTTLRMVAAFWSDHPDYQQDWASPSAR